MDHLDLVPQEALEWKAGLFGSGVQVTSCLANISSLSWNEARDQLLSTSKHIRPNLSMFGWYIFVRNRILGGVMG
jgi:hypothetical protein